MRLNEPFHGIVLVGGHVVFHVALLIASIIVIRFPKEDENNKELIDFIGMFRIAHAVNVVYKAIDYMLSSPDKFAKYMFTQKLFETISMFLYFVVAMNVIYGIGLKDVQEESLAKDKMLQKERTWIFIEISGFLLQIFSASIYLVIQQFRGMCGRSLY